MGGSKGWLGQERLVQWVRQALREFGLKLRVFMGKKTEGVMFIKHGQRRDIRAQHRDIPESSLANVVTFRRTSRRSRRVRLQRRNVEVQRRDVPGSL